LFTAAHPEIELRLSADRALIDALRGDSATSAGEAAAQTEAAAVTIRFGTGSYPRSRSDRLFECVVTPLCSPALMQGEHPLRAPDDLRHHILLHDDTVYFNEDEADWAVWLRAASVKGVDASRGPRFSHAALALDAAVQGLGVALGVPELAAADLAAGRLIAPFQLEVRSNRSYYLVCAEATADRPNVVAFREWLLREVGMDR
jgi:LysR family glycine cleavage system transcriptional activator